MGNVIIVSFRNFSADTQEKYFLIDEEVEEDEIDVDQDEILERYLMKQREDINTLARTSKELKCLINKNAFKEVKVEQKMEQKVEQKVE